VMSKTTELTNCQKFFSVVFVMSKTTELTDCLKVFS
jgi:hypothetical protein